MKGLRLSDEKGNVARHLLLWVCFSVHKEGSTFCFSVFLSTFLKAPLHKIYEYRTSALQDLISLDKRIKTIIMHLRKRKHILKIFLFSSLSVYGCKKFVLLIRTFGIDI